jgi:putative transposase
MRKIPLVNGEYYHIYNRGVEKRDIFMHDFDYHRFLTSLKEFNQVEPVLSLYISSKVPVGIGSLQKKKLVEVVAFCLIENHYHLILKQLVDGGISEFMKRLGTGYTGYFNCKYKRSGALFQGKFKSIHIDSNDYLLYLSAYVNGNYLVHGKSDWKYSSLYEYQYGGEICDAKVITGQFENFTDYNNFVKTNALAVHEKREELKNYLQSGARDPIPL